MGRWWKIMEAQQTGLPFEHGIIGLCPSSKSWADFWVDGYDQEDQWFFADPQNSPFSCSFFWGNCWHEMSRLNTVVEANYANYAPKPCAIWGLWDGYGAMGWLDNPLKLGSISDDPILIHFTIATQIIRPSECLMKSPHESCLQKLLGRILVQRKLAVQSPTAVLVGDCKTGFIWRITCTPKKNWP